MTLNVGIRSTAGATSITMDLQYLVKRVANLMRRDDLDVEIQEWLNFAMWELTDRVNFPELRYTDAVPVTLVLDQPNYDLPDDYSRMDAIFYLDDSQSPTWGMNLRPLPRRFYRGDIVDRESLLHASVTADHTGDPMYYYVENDTLYLDPSPNKPGKIYRTYYKLPTDLTLATQEPDIKKRWRHYLIWLAYFWGMVFQEKEDIIKVRLWQKKFNDTIKMVRKAVRRTENTREDFSMPDVGTERADSVYN